MCEYVLALQDTSWDRLYLCRSCGLDVHIISAQEAKELCPILKTDDVIVSQYFALSAKYLCKQRP